ncbi:hydrogenase expression/formation protein HypC [Caldicellulosiruptor bescii]|jgi:hydrogenase expression/formation protein HypC|uniref:Hydrogenase assembly chaperone hypC/hupF n=2 Tax=Caldicellulosiruptor bescii TaxID=31899 RepID=B9MR88_CALBD|nr:HypC/HybG/HupF family hydrogenase formation chaperone [Caldicellulosiruptor bescii]ACM60192.1 hydrogenase assembly chaperone hypC/hupF [Caldicellulosiruptor bescii DSM 6725]PBC87607.1 hydrogenase expression/formation protein HypC [Caldicellulosiruptor bescii]PBC90540.1 hydrogenase expression/formation protein HypC [Caldicellulosiruptor bescii]PBD04028.1 hydrogenase expression/formation protein HypC [Caldicellulosiruptor bescii]PBD06337.1 hydrogenase expression/formation protein HypC [Caldic
MCLGYPAKVIEILEDGKKAIVDYLGLKKTVNVSLIKELAVGDYLLIHSGVAIEKIDEKEAEEIEKLFGEVRNANS